MQDKIDCNNINEIREERNANLIYTGSATSRAYVQSSSNPLEIFHNICKTPFTKSEPHKDNPSLVFKNPLLQETHGLLNPFSEIRRRNLS